MHVALLNRICDSLMTAGSKVRLKAWSAFFVMGLVGLFAAISVGSSLAVVSGLSRPLFATLCIVSLAAFLSSALLTKMIVGKERLTLYQHKLVVIAFSSALLTLIHQPVLPYLDVILIAVGIFVVFGRFGCLWVGCCHGRPHRWGIRYTDLHAAMGLDPIYVGLRVIPVQVIEAAWMLLIVLIGIGLILNHARPGEAVTWYVIGYGFGRFWLEFLRADAERGYFCGFSEAQWTSLVLMSIVVLLESVSRLPFHLGSFAVTALLGVSMIAISLRARYQNTTRRLSEQPGHVGEIAEAIQLATSMALYRCDVCKQKDEASLMHLAATSLGFQVSASRIRRPTSWAYHYAISYRHGSLTLRTLKLAAELVRQVRGTSSSVDVIKGRQVAHLLVES